MRKALLAVALTASALQGSCTPPPSEDPSLLFNRIWLEAKPEKPTDYVHGAFLLPRPAVGVFQRSSAYDFHFERFDHRRDGQKLALTFPQTGKTAEITFTVTACNALPPFDLCLDLSDNPWGGPKRYYGSREQEDDAAMREIRAHLPVR